MGDISRRKFLKGTGKTILTGAVVGTVGLSGGTTTPIKTVAPKATTWKNLSVLSPKAKAYRTFLRGIKHIGGEKGTIKSLIANDKSKSKWFKSVKAFTGHSIGRHAFEHSIASGKIHRTDRKITGSGKSIAHNRLAFKNVDLGRPSATIAKIIAPDISTTLDEPYEARKGRINRLSDTIHRTGRDLLAKEIREQRKIDKSLPDPEQIKKVSKIKGTSKGGGRSSAGGGGSKFGMGGYKGMRGVNPWHLLQNNKNF